MGINTDFISVDKFKPGKPSEPSDRRDRVDQCKVIWYQWDNSLLTAPNATLGPQLPGFEIPTLATATAYDISDHITNFTYSKGLADAAGSFSFSLGNSIEWQKYMKPGTWLVVYLSKNGDLLQQSAGASASFEDVGGQILSGLPGMDTLTGLLGAGATKPSAKPELDAGPSSKTHEAWAEAGYRRCIGMVQRVGVRSHMLVNGATDVEFVVSGKDFGVVFEETELWFNMWNSEKSVWSDLAAGMQQDERNLTATMSLYYDVFFNPTSLDLGETNKLNVARLMGEKSKQWIIPDVMGRDLSLDAKYFGQISGMKNFSPTLFEMNEPNPLAGVEGIAWDFLKGISEPYFHELFTELSDDGEPKLVYRPIPWGFDKGGYQRMGYVIPSFKQHLEGTWEPALTDVLKQLTGLGADAITGISKIFDSSSADADETSFAIDTVEVESFDLGPAFHERFNFFLVDYASNVQQQNTAILAIQESLKGEPFPYLNKADSERHGFKPMITRVQALVHNAGTSALFGSGNTQSPNLQFILEANSVLKDYHGNADDFYSGSLIIAGNNQTKLGKIIQTDKSFPVLGEMAFYIEGYTDNFTVDENGTGQWSQTVELTRGIEMSDLMGKVANLSAAVKSQDNVVKPHNGTFFKDRK